MTTTVEHQPERSRYALLDGDETVGVAEYAVQGESIVFTHTEVDPERREEGLGSILVRAALDDVRDDTTLTVVPRCPYVATWIELHPDYAGLLTR